MPDAIAWESDLDAALAKARQSARPVLADVFNPDCPHCRRMAAETYPDPALAALVSESFVPVRLDFHDQELAARLGVASTPTLLVLEPDTARESGRVEGFRPPAELAALLTLTLVRRKLDGADPAGAQTLLADLPASGPEAARPEAIYLAGKIAHRLHSEPAYLARMARELAERYPGSPAALAAERYLLL